MTEQELIEIAKTIDHETILSPEQRQKLSPSASKLYTALWFLGFTRNGQTLFVDDRDLSQRSHVALNFLPTVTKELADAALVTVSAQRNGSVYTLLKN